MKEKTNSLFAHCVQSGRTMEAVNSAFTDVYGRMKEDMGRGAGTAVKCTAEALMAAAYYVYLLGVGDGTKSKQQTGAEAKAGGEPENDQTPDG